jgi:NADH-quinone oxidoreductase subunit M
MNEISVQGVMVQMFNHGINIIGLWIVVDLIEKQTGVKKISQLGGIATKAPMLTIMMIIIAFANIALPLTNAFIGEFMMFTGVYKHNIWMAVAAALSVILSAVYTLNMIQKVFYGNTNSVTENMRDISSGRQLGLALIVIMIFVFGIYPQPMIDLTKSAVTLLVAGK